MKGCGGGAARGIHYPGERWGLRKRGFLMTRKRQVRGEPSPSPPSPSAPPPRGDSPSIHCHGGDFFSRFQARNSPKILSPRRGTVSGSIATHCPPPLEGAGGGLDERPGGGGCHRKRRSPGVVREHCQRRCKIPHMLPGRGGEVYITELLI